MAPSVTRWLANFSSHHQWRNRSASSSDSSGEAVKHSGHPLSVQSTLESLQLNRTPIRTPGTPSSSLRPLLACVSPYTADSPSTATAAAAGYYPLYNRLYDSRGPVIFSSPPLKGARLFRGELALWSNEKEKVISQNSSNRRVHRATWTSASDPDRPHAAALKFVEDGNPRDGRSLKREIECHIYLYQKLPMLYKLEQELRSSQLGFSFIQDDEWATVGQLDDAWPSSELFGYHLDKKNPGRSVLLTRKLSGPDLFDVIRSEHNHTWHFHHPSSSQRCKTIYSTRPRSLLSSDQCAYYPANYEYHKLRWSAIALKRVAQYAALSVRHNDVKPDNIVLDFYTTKEGNDKLDVKLIDLGTASMHNAKDFTGGTSWYESPEQKLLEFFMKKKKDPEAARRVDIDLPSDLWGTGISLAEVLVGRRVVDTLKPPRGPGPLEYLGFDSWTRRGGSQGSGEEYPYWAMDPSDWVFCARNGLGLDHNNDDRLTVEAARWLFDHLVTHDPSQRIPLSTAMFKMEKFAEEAYQRFRYSQNSFDKTSSIKSPLFRRAAKHSPV